MSIWKKLGQDPSKSFRFFLIGLASFAIGLALVYGFQEQETWQMFGIALIGVGCLVSAWGYIGIFASRILDMMNKHPRS